MRFLRAPASVALIMAIVAVSGCGEAPEQRIRERIEEARIAAEAGKLNALGAMLAEDFVDDRGNDRAAVLAIIGYYVRIEGGLHIWIRIDEIEITEPGRARARLLVALATGPVEQLEDLVRLRAEVHRLTLQFEEASPEDWQMTHVTRTRASLADVL